MKHFSIFRFFDFSIVALAAGGVLAAGAAEITLPVATVENRAMFRDSVFPGRVTPIARVDVIPQVSGEILEVCFDNGAHVKAGDKLYRLDPVKYEAAVKNAEAKLTELKASLSYAELSYARHRKLLDTRAVSLDAVDNALSQRDAARASLNAVQADLVAARHDLAHCTIVAPIDGKAGSTAKTKGNYVKAGGEPLVTIVQRMPIRVRFSISNRELLDRFVGPGRQKDVRVTVALADGTLLPDEGTIEYADNAADELTDTVTLFARFENKDLRLVAGGTVTVTLSSRSGVPMPAIPPTAILQDVQGPYVWVLDAANVASRRSVARGDTIGDWLFIEKGLKPGERIVAVGAHKVKRGMTVIPAPAAKPAAGK